MKLDLLCELDLLAEKLEMAALSPKYMLNQLEDPEEIKNSIYKTISLLDNAIEILKGYLSPECTFITRFYYELQANALEINNPKKITNFYNIRIKDIMQRIEDDEDNFTQTELVLTGLRAYYDKGLISEDTKEKIERKRYYLTGLWLELFDWVRGDLESIKSESSRPKREKETEDIQLLEEEIAGIKKCGNSYFEFKRGKYEYIKVRNGKTDWAALSYIFLKIHGMNLNNHTTRLRKYWNYADLFKRMNDENKTDNGIRRCAIWRDAIDKIFAS